MRTMRRRNGNVPGMALKNWREIHALLFFSFRSSVPASEGVRVYSDQTVHLTFVRPPFPAIVRSIRRSVLSTLQSLQLMVKQKQRQLLAKPAAKNNTSNGLIDSPNSESQGDLSGEDSWVIVKKQRVTILVPSLPAAKQPTAQNPGSSQQATPRKTINNQSQFPLGIHHQMHSVDEQEKSMSLAPKKDIHMARKIASSQPISKLEKEPRLDFIMGSEFRDHVGTLKSHELPGTFSTVRAVEQPKFYNGPICFLDGGVFLNQRLRASNIERKIRRAGGLSQWLASLGLEQFVRIFMGKNVNKFQLVNLTMKKLKDMGAEAVGPRRKLMHAIDCLCQPHCFKTV